MIYIECENDFLTLNFLGYSYNVDFKHPRGKGNVLKALKDTSVSLGIIDEDPYGGKYPQLSSYPIVETENRLNLRKNNNSQLKILIELPNNLEVWLTGMAKDLKLDLKGYGVLDSFGKFRKTFTGTNKQRFLN